MSEDWSPITPTTGFWIPVSSANVSLAVAVPAEQASSWPRFSSCILVKKPLKKILLELKLQHNFYKIKAKIQ